ncbi:hypothetical protein B0T21DRAFT_416080 [Apiosordaria backusii]|uniref:Uncharacterized protein n=1 Tax=Apiosordaria backusii TaxID=314023 RepID=A0AA40A7B6_9PEZI|nr:hypothetical protein B0T21DRAFT_416080 [Apiosordaria backusii]
MPASRKRSSTALQSDAGQNGTAAKRVKVLLENDEEKQTIKQAREEIALLKSHLKDSLDFIEKKNLHNETSGSLNELLRLRMGSVRLGNALMIRMTNTHGKIYDRLDFAKASLTSDDLSWAMPKFIPAIRELSEFGDKGCIGVAYKLLVKCRDYSWTTEICGYGDRAPDNVPDNLLASLVPKY